MQGLHQPHVVNSGVMGERDNGRVVVARRVSDGVIRISGDELYPLDGPLLHQMRPRVAHDNVVIECLSHLGEILRDLAAANEK